MNVKHVFGIILLVVLFNCKSKFNLSKIEGKRLPIDNTLKTDTLIENFIAPYKNHIEKDLDSILAYAVATYSKNDGELNTAIGNLMADIVFLEGSTIFKKRTGKTIDAVILNHGGIRSEIPQGPVNARTAYNVMPFENEIVVVALKGKNINDAVNYLVKSKRAHPIAGMEIILDEDYLLISAKINNEPVDTEKVYYIATSDYLYNNGDNMSFYKPNESVYKLGYKIRNSIIDYFKKTDTISPIRDNRFIRQY
ncbi:5'-nucleotidase [Flavobacteriaceae bacterium MHTCC 0001]